MMGYHNSLIKGFFIAFFFETLISCSVTGLECYTGPGGTGTQRVVCGNHSNSTQETPVQTTTPRDLTSSSTSQLDGTGKNASSPANVTHVTAPHLAVVIPGVLTQPIEHCITKTSVHEAGTLVFKEMSSIYGCDEELNCAQHADKQAASHTVKQGNTTYNIKCCNTTLCNRDNHSKPKVNATGPLKCYKGGQTEECLPNIQKCIYSKIVVGTAPTSPQGTTLMANESLGCDLPKLNLCDGPQGSNPKCRLVINPDLESITLDNVTLCVCCCQGNLCNQNLSKLHKQCQGLMNTNNSEAAGQLPVPDHKPDGSTRKTLVVGLVSGGVMLVIGMVLGAIIYRRVRRRGEGTQSLLQYRRVNADCVDDMEDVRMLLS